MARERGTFNFSASLEPKKQGALDARLVVQTYAELTQAATWADTDNKIWLYDGMIVSVVADTTGRNGVYMLTNKDVYNSASNWIQIDAKAAEKTNIIDSLTSSDVTAALSANQGRVLNEKIEEHITDADVHITTEERTKLAGIEDGAQVNTVLGVKGDAEATYRVGQINITKANIGLDKVENLAPSELPVSTATQDAIDALQDELNEFKNSKGQANGLASLDENGKIPASQLNGELGRVVGIQKFVNTRTDLDSVTPAPEEGDKYYVSDEDKIYTYTSGAFDEGAEPHENTIYNHRLADSEGRTNVLYRWDGSTMVEISASLTVGETSGTAYEGDKGKQLRTDFDAHASNKNNPHSVTKAQVGLGNVENLAPADLPVSTATKTELDKKVDKEAGKSLVDNTLITKLEGLKDQTEITQDITNIQNDITNLGDTITNVTGQSTENYVPNANSNYIKTATDLNNADVLLDAQIKKNADAIDQINGTGTGSIDNKIQSAIDGLKGTASEDFDTLGEIENAIRNESKERKDGDQEIKDTIGTVADSSSDNTIYGAIKKEEEARIAADDAIKSDINTKLGNKTSSTIDATNVWGAIEELESEAKSANNAANALTGRVTTLEGEMDAAEARITKNEQDIAQNASNFTSLDTAVSQFKDKTVSTTITKPGNNTSLPTTKAVVDYVTTATNGVAKSMTYTPKSGDASKMELKLIAVDGSTLTTIEMDKENFLSGFIKREATSEDVAADSTLTVGDPILVVTLTNGDVFRVSLKSLVDIYTGQATNSITTTVTGYTVKADLKLDTTTQNSSPVKLTVGSNGLSANISFDTTNGTKGISLTKSGNGIAAELKIDTATNTANGIEMTVGANGLSAALVWEEL